MSTITVKDGTTIYYKSGARARWSRYSHGRPLNRSTLSKRSRIDRRGEKWRADARCDSVNGLFAHSRQVAARVTMVRASSGELRPFSRHPHARLCRNTRNSGDPRTVSRRAEGTHE